MKKFIKPKNVLRKIPHVKNSFKNIFQVKPFKAKNFINLISSNFLKIIFFFFSCKIKKKFSPNLRIVVRKKGF